MNEVEIPTSWRGARLAELGEWGSGGTPSRSNPSYYGGGIPWLKIGDLNDGEIWESEESISNSGLANSSAKLLEPGIVLVAMYGSIGKIGLTRISCATNQAIAFCRPDKRVVDSKFLFWGLRYLRPRLVSMGQGGAQLNISQTLLKDVQLPVAPLGEQRRIVEKIETLFAELDKGEESLRQVQVLLARYRQSVLKAAVTGELTADWRAQRAGQMEHGRDLLARILKTRRENWQGRGKYKEPVEPDTTNLPELPEGWVWASLAQLTWIKGGVTVDKKRAPSNPVTLPYLRVANVQNGYLDLCYIKEITVEAEKAEECLLQPGDILLNEGGDRDKLGRGWVWSGEGCSEQIFR